MKKLFLLQLIAVVLLTGCWASNPDSYEARLQSYFQTYYPNTSLSGATISASRGASDVVLTPNPLIPGTYNVTNSTFQDLGTVRQDMIIPGQFRYSPPLPTSGGSSWGKSSGKK